MQVRSYYMETFPDANHDAGIFTYIGYIYGGNVDRYSIHGASGFDFSIQLGNCESQLTKSRILSWQGPTLSCLAITGFLATWGDEYRLVHVGYVSCC